MISKDRRQNARACSSKQCLYKKKYRKQKQYNTLPKKGDEYKLDLLQNLEDGSISFIPKIGFTDLCRGPTFHRPG